MKKYLFVMFIFISSKVTLADCRAQYESYKKQGIENVVSKTLSVATLATPIVGGIAAGLTGIVPVALIPGAIVVAGAISYEGYVVISNIKENKMIKLINQSESYLLDQTRVPGKLLRKFHQDLNRPDLSLDSLAKYITDSNYDLSLCSQTESLKKIKKKLKQGATHAPIELM